MNRKSIQFDTDLGVKRNYSLRWLLELSAKLRPESFSNEQAANSNIEQLIYLLEQNPESAKTIGVEVLKIFKNYSFVSFITESGFTTNESFFIQLRQLLFEKILPESYDRDDILYIFNQLFYKNGDYEWMTLISTENWSKLFTILGYEEFNTLNCQNYFLRQILNCIQVISIRINSIGISSEIVEKFPQLENFESPFMAQQHEIQNYIEKYFSEGFDRGIENQHYRHILVLLDQCEEYVQMIKKKKNVFGVSFKLTNYLIRLGQNIKRLRKLLALITFHPETQKFSEEINFFRVLINNLKERKSFRYTINKNLELMAQQVIENTSQVGALYITETFSQYIKMLLSSCGGGLIVGFLTIIKVIIYYLQLPYFGTAFLYSMNYSFGFILIHLTGSKLATKQPAMTASRLALAIDDKVDDKEEIDDLVKMVRLIFRSQFISFVGNVIISFPVALLISSLYFFITGQDIVTEAKANELIEELNPLKSLSLLHAAITGFYLFLSGLLTGYYENFSYVSKLHLRIKDHPLLRKLLPSRFLIRFSYYIENNFGQLLGNLFLGIFLGTTSTFGKIVGLPLDIRHITFSAGNFGIALSKVGHDITTQTFLISIIGILLIGFINFIVSFGLSLIVAIESKGSSISRGKILVKRIIRLFLKNPIAFFLPMF